MYQNHLLKWLTFLHWIALVSLPPKNYIYEWVYPLDYLLCFKKMTYMSRSTLWIIFSVSLISSLFNLYVHPFDNTILSWLLYLYSIFEIKNASLFCYSSKLLWLFMTFVSPTFILETIWAKTPADILIGLALILDIILCWVDIITMLSL